MELFHEIYGCYFHILRRILTQASKQPLSVREMRRIAAESGFGESEQAVLPKLLSGEWPFLEPCAKGSSGETLYRSRLRHVPRTPLSGLQRSWLKALLADERFPLFVSPEELDSLRMMLQDAPALYRQEDFLSFDRYLDGDPYDDPGYRQRFAVILDALTQNRILLLSYEGKHSRRVSMEAAPVQLSFSARDNKFRLFCLRYFHGAYRLGVTLNLARINACILSSQPAPPQAASQRFRSVSRTPEPVVLEIDGERNALERCMLHFASYEKQTEYDGQSRRWRCSIYYDRADETDLLIDVLSFGPVVKVLGPASFLQQVRKRVERQYRLLWKAGEESANLSG